MWKGVPVKSGSPVHRRRVAGFATVVAFIGALAVGAPSLAQAGPVPSPHETEATAAGTWLAGQLDDHAMQGFANTDWGLTIDTLFALTATRADPAEARAVADNVAAHVRAYDSMDDYGYPGVTVSGAAAKILVAAESVGDDPTNFGGRDMRAEVLGTMQTGGAFAGRFSDQYPADFPGGGVDNSNTFGQSLAVIGLAGSTGGVPQEAVDFLIKQQCATGGFRLSPDMFGTPSPTCDDSPDAVLDPDSTAMAVQALLAADRAGAGGAAAAAAAGVAWLRSVQRDDGSVGGSGPTAAPNTNSTGLAGEALAAGGDQEAADRAADWVAAHELTAGNAGAASASVGAIAYNDDSLADARANGISDVTADQWRRATAQAVLALAQVPLYALAGGDGSASPSMSASASAPGSAPVTPSSGATATGTAGATADPSADASTSSRTSPGGTALATSPVAVGGSLPVTGGPLIALAATAMVLLGGGTATVVLARRRRTVTR